MAESIAVESVSDSVFIDNDYGSEIYFTHDAYSDLRVSVTLPESFETFDLQHFYE